MTEVPLGMSTYRRDVAKEPEIVLKNRFLERNPTNQADQVALIVRPGLSAQDVLDGLPIRQTHHEKGAFGGDLFIVAGPKLFRKNWITKLVTQIAGTIQGTGQPSMTIVEVGGTPRLYITDGFLLQWTAGGPLAIIPTPDDIPMIWLDHIVSHVICVRNASRRFFWIEPGDVTIDPLNFAEAERSSDHILNVNVVGDQVWFFKQETTEVWFPTGDLNAPFQRIKGRLFDRGVWESTGLRVRDSIIVVGNDAVVYSVAAGPQRISTHGIEERIRKAMAVQNDPALQ